MKKILILLFLFALLGSTSAQFASGLMIKQTTSDTIKTGALTVTKYITLTSGYNAVGIQSVVTKVDGTPAGNAKLYGSIDGTNYVQISADTLAIANVATSTKIWTLTGIPYAKLKLVYTGVGTMRALEKTWYTARKTITE